MEILNIENLSFSYPECEKNTLEKISFSVEKGDFVLLMGDTGSGKTTLLKCLKNELRPKGNLRGSITIKGEKLSDLTSGDSARKIGFIMQNPEMQIVTDKVWHELAFGLENLGVQPEIIKRRIGEMACYFGIDDWIEKNVSSLSGGQKQLLNLASVMAMNPSVLILDEPTSQLDPITALNFISTLKRLCEEISLTVIIAEHRCDEILPLSNKLLLLKNGKLAYYGETKDITAKITDKSLLANMPATVRFCNEIGETPCLSVNESRRMLENKYKNHIRSIDRPEKKLSAETVLKITDLYFRYEKASPDVLKGLSLEAKKGEHICVMGGNGSGKTTLLSVIAGLRKPLYGKIKILGKDIKNYVNSSLYNSCLAMMPQDVSTLFIKETVEEELIASGVELKTLPFDLSNILKSHPFDISGGEMQLLGLAKIIGANPQIILLDEPTKGLDFRHKTIFGDAIHSLNEKGVTVITVTHDVEFSAEYATECAFIFRGEITDISSPENFFGGNKFYTTAIHRMTDGFYDSCVTISSASELCKLNGKKDGIL